jgi:HD-GYP domain-containing protein (c-di-GMP phosphodiesterase class II)
LTEEEWAAMKNHPVEGAEIVSRVSELAYVADIVRHHHERVDGGGYPDGLRGNDIPLLSRVIAVADSYEVMTTNRIYRSALPRETAVARLQEGAGRQFDPEIVEVFLRIEPESLLLS